MDVRLIEVGVLSEMAMASSHKEGRAVSNGAPSTIGGFGSGCEILDECPCLCLLFSSDDDDVDENETFFAVAHRFEPSPRDRISVYVVNDPHSPSGAAFTDRKDGFAFRH